MYNEAAANDGMWDKIIPESTISAWDHAYATGNYGPYNDYFPQVAGGMKWLAILVFNRTII